MIYTPWGAGTSDHVIGDGAARQVLGAIASPVRRQIDAVPRGVRHRRAIRVGQRLVLHRRESLDSMEAGFTSRDPGGSNPQAMPPNSTLDLGTLIAARTSGAPYQMYRETETGTIEVGKRGDFIVVNQHPFSVPTNELHKTQVLMTFLDGALIYQAPAGARLAHREPNTSVQKTP